MDSLGTVSRPDLGSAVVHDSMSPASQPAALRYSVVVPVYHEAANIGEFCRRALRDLPPDYEVLICYDMPEDSTLPALAAIPAAARPDRMRLIHNQLGRGVRYAIEAGFRAATAPLVLVTMVDLSDELGNVPEMLRLAESGKAVVCGSRYMRGGRQIGGPWLKTLLSRTAGSTLHLLAGVPTWDATNSFKVYRKDFLDRQVIESQAGFCLGLELTVKAHFEGNGVAEVPAIWHDRTTGQSRFRLWHWMPHYLQWYFRALGYRWLGRDRWSGKSSRS